jgi:hypothetical protein
MAVDGYSLSANGSSVLIVGLGRNKHNNYRKHETEKRRPRDVIQESARTTVSQKNTVAGMTGHSNSILIDFHRLISEA